MTYMLLSNCALKLVEEIILYYDVRSKKHKKKCRGLSYFNNGILMLTEMMVALIVYSCILQLMLQTGEICCLNVLGRLYVLAGC